MSPSPPDTEAQFTIEVGPHWFIFSPNSINPFQDLVDRKHYLTLRGGIWIGSILNGGGSSVGCTRPTRRHGGEVTTLTLTKFISKNRGYRLRQCPPKGQSPGGQQITRRGGPSGTVVLIKRTLYDASSLNIIIAEP
ncbi:hypothetical protein QVD99_003347 [Batrachochytrium dendrobatidis]|nr:hypothetical protein QVD99_003347 [Batrachochytrium dendrobatidis]